MQQNFYGTDFSTNQVNSRQTAGVGAWYLDNSFGVGREEKSVF